MDFHYWDVIHLEAAVYNVDESSKTSVCDACASALNGIVNLCTLSDSSMSERRNLVEADIVFMEIEVEDYADALAMVEADDFVENLENIPSSLAVMTVEEYLDVTTTEEEESTEIVMEEEETTEIVTDEIQTTEEIQQTEEKQTTEDASSSSSGIRK